MRMRVSLSGLLSHAAGALDDLAAEVRSAAGWEKSHDTDGGDGEYPDDPAADADYYAFALREASRHARETAAGGHAVAEFAEFYCLAEPPPGLCDGAGI